MVLRKASPPYWLNVPNALSFYRLCAAPVAFALILAGNGRVFAYVILASLFTDVLDGLIARLFNQQTDIGARLDSLADELTFVVAMIGILVFKYEVLRDDVIWLYVFLFFNILSSLVPLIKFGRLPAFHLYSFKATGYLLALNFVLIFSVGYVRELFLLAMVFGTLATIEIIVVALLLKEFRTDQKGLYWVLRDRMRRNP